MFPPANPQDRVYYLADSSAEYYPPLGADSFHIYLPRQVMVYSASRVQAPVNITEGVTILVRAFSLAGASPEGQWADTPYTLRVNIRPWASGSPNMGRPLSLKAAGIYSAFNPGPGGGLSNTFKLYPSYMPGGSLAFTHHLSDYMGYSAELDRDPVLENRVILRGFWDWQLLGLEIGGFLGMNDAPEALFINPGLSVLFKLKIPRGIFEFSFRLDSSLGRELRATGDFRQDLYDIHAIAVLPWVQLDASLNNRAATIRTEGVSFISNFWSRYQLLILLVGDNWPVRIGFFGGFQEIAWLYGHNRYLYESLFAGAQVSWRVMPALEIFASADAPVLPLEYLGSPTAAAILNASVGIRWDF